MPTPGFILDLGIFECAVIGIIALLLFGHKLPAVLYNIRNNRGELKRFVSTVSDDIEAGAGRLLRILDEVALSISRLAETSVRWLKTFGPE